MKTNLLSSWIVERSSHPRCTADMPGLALACTEAQQILCLMEDSNGSKVVLEKLRLTGISNAAQHCVYSAREERTRESGTCLTGIQRMSV